MVKNGRIQKMTDDERRQRWLRWARWYEMGHSLRAIADLDGTISWRGVHHALTELGVLGRSLHKSDAPDGKGDVR